MQSIYKGIGTLCLCGYITSLILNIYPANHTQKSIKLICCLYIILISFSPLTNISFDMEYPVADYNIVNSEADDYVLTKAAENIENIIKNRLKKENVAYTDIKIHISKTAEGVSVSGIDIKGCEPCRKSIIIRLLDDIVSAENINTEV